MTDAEITALNGRPFSASESPVGQILIGQREGQRSILFQRLPKEYAALMATFTDHASQGANFGDILHRNASGKEPSRLLIRDCHPYNFEYRSETDDWFYRRELCLSHAMFDTIIAVLSAEFPVEKKGHFFAQAAITLEDIRLSDIDYERPYSGSVLRGEHPIRSVLLSPRNDDEAFAQPEPCSGAIRLIESA